MKKALIFQGGWPGHHPEQMAMILAEWLEGEGFVTDITDTLDTLQQVDLLAYDLIVPNWSNGTITDEQLAPLLLAVQKGVGLAGMHGGMAGAFRKAVQYQFMVGGQWVAHPGNDGILHTVNIVDSQHPLTRGMTDFQVVSEQYYMHVDPVIDVLATTRFPTVDGPHSVNGEVDMPVVWTKRWGQGRVYYCSLGHDKEIARMPEVTALMRKGLLWAARREQS